jgi:hypothetical protein
MPFIPSRREFLSTLRPDNGHSCSSGTLLPGIGRMAMGEHASSRRRAWPARVYLAVGLAGCGSAPEPELATVAEPPVIAVAVGETTRPVRFSKLVLDLERGDDMGSVQVGVLCAPHTQLVFEGGRHSLNNDDLAEVFAGQLRAANYRVVGDPDALFEDPADEGPDFLVAGLVKEMESRVCYPMSGFGNFSDATGEAFMAIAWRIYSRAERAVVLELTTEGFEEIDQATPGADAEVYLGAFAQAVRNLLADPAFYVLVSGSGKPSEPAGRQQTAPNSGRAHSPAGGTITDFGGGPPPPE